MARPSRLDPAQNLERSRDDDGEAEPLDATEDRLVGDPGCVPARLDREAPVEEIGALREVAENGDRLVGAVPRFVGMFASETTVIPDPSSAPPRPLGNKQRPSRSLVNENFVKSLGCTANVSGTTKSSASLPIALCNESISSLPVCPSDRRVGHPGGVQDPGQLPRCPSRR